MEDQDNNIGKIRITYHWSNMGKTMLLLIAISLLVGLINHFLGFTTEVDVGVQILLSAWFIVGFVSGLLWKPFSFEK